MLNTYTPLYFTNYKSEKINLTKTHTLLWFFFKINNLCKFGYTCITQSISKTYYTYISAIDFYKCYTINLTILLLSSTQTNTKGQICIYIYIYTNFITFQYIYMCTIFIHNKQTCHIGTLNKQHRITLQTCLAFNASSKNIWQVMWFDITVSLIKSTKSNIITDTYGDPLYL